MKGLIAIAFFIAVTGLGCSKNTIPGEATGWEEVLRSKQFTFIAETANPVGATPVRLSYGYDLIVKPNAVVATLPYYGRAYTADRSFNGMRFTTTSFSYDEARDSDGNLEVVIRPVDVPGIQELRLSVSASGYAILGITSTERQPISYNGRIGKSEAD